MENEQAGTNVMQMYTEVIVPNDSNVLKIFAEDLDDGDNGRVTYSILPNANFSIDSLTGTLSALVSFDREAQSSYEFQVFAEDHGQPAQTSTATVVVNILDQNDHPPHFGQPVFYLEVEENLAPGSPVGHVMAIDEDTGPNAKMIYSIIRDDDSSRYFSVDRDSGVVTFQRDV
nr:hypothetical protein BaRGS_008133 [Batillaria attramentaria]